jgi:hypothetical protein
MSFQKMPETAVAEGIPGITWIHVPFAVSLARKSQNCIGAGFDAAGDLSREMDAEEWKDRVWHRVNQIPDEALGLGAKPEILAPKRNDSNLPVSSGQIRYAIALKARTTDYEIGNYLGRSVAEDPCPSLFENGFNPEVRLNSSAE